MARTVLLADDSVTAQNMGRRILTDAGYEVITVNNGSAALKKIHESRPDLIVLDVYMPGYGGLEVCQRLKESEATQRIPVLLTVGKMEPFKTEEAKRVRADGHIIKPFDASELLAALTKLEDRIVPQSENGRGKGKSEKKSRRWGAGEDPAKASDQSRVDQVAYLQSVKSRQATSKDGVEESAADLPAESDDSAEEAVTFAAGPIYEPSSAPEFPVQGESSSEAPAQSTVRAAESTESLRDSAAAQSEPAADATSEVRAASVEEPPAPSEESNTIESGPRWIAENVALTADEASCSLDEEMRRAQSNESAEAASQEPEMAAVSDPAPQPAAHNQVEPVSADEEAPAVISEATPEPARSEGAAFAAAASSSGVSSQAVSNQTTESQPSSDSETAAWEQVCDSADQRLPESLVRSVTEMAQRSFAQEAQASQDESSSAADQADKPEQAKSQEPTPQAASGDALSSIVDTVLAELKPRLLAEIAKQLSTDKK